MTAPSAGSGSSTESELLSSFDCRYAGQSHELTVASIGDFEAEHRRRNGFARPGTPVEVVAIRAVARQHSPIGLGTLADPGTRRGVHPGPAVIAEADCTIWVPPGWTAAVGGGGAWVLTR
jgi:N-methylhydantoinase A/oxoprolinase/acetone carboxylase beta subunit